MLFSAFIIINLFDARDQASRGSTALEIIQSSARSLRNEKQSWKLWWNTNFLSLLLILIPLLFLLFTRFTQINCLLHEYPAICMNDKSYAWVPQSSFKKQSLGISKISLLFNVSIDSQPQEIKVSQTNHRVPNEAPNLNYSLPFGQKCKLFALLFAFA